MTELNILANQTRTQELVLRQAKRLSTMDLFIIYNQTTGAGLDRPSYSFQIKLTRDFTF